MCTDGQGSSVGFADGSSGSTVDREGKVEIGALRGYVMTLDVHHESILNAPPDPAEAVGYWRTLKGAKRALVAPSNGEIAAWAGCKLMHAGHNGASRKNRQLS